MRLGAGLGAGLKDGRSLAARRGGRDAGGEPGGPPPAFVPIRRRSDPVAAACGVEVLDLLLRAAELLLGLPLELVAALARDIAHVLLLCRGCRADSLMPRGANYRASGMPWGAEQRRTRRRRTERRRTVERETVKRTFRLEAFS